MPVQVVPPMYNMLANEIKWALADVCSPLCNFYFLIDLFFSSLGNKQGEPYHFTHLIILSRVYHLSEEEESVLANSAPPTRRSRPQGDDSNTTQNRHKKQRAQENGEIKPAPDGIYSFHPEDDIIMKVRAIALSKRLSLFDTLL